MINIEELLIYYQRKGLRETVARLKVRYGRVVTFVVNSCDLDQKDLAPLPDPEYRVVVDDLPSLRKIRSGRTGLPREFYVDRMHNGKRFYLLCLEDEPAYIHWVFGKGEYSRFCRIRDERTVELAYSYTMPAFRGNNLVAKMINYSCRDLQEKGYRRVVNVVAQGNVSCHRGMRTSILREYCTIRSYYSIIRRVAV